MNATSDIDFPRLYRSARLAAMRYAPAGYSSWGDDIVQEVVLAYVLAVRDGKWPGRRFFVWQAKEAADRIFGSAKASRGRRECHVLIDFVDDVASTAEVSPLRTWAKGLCMRRLQEVWPTLTPHQRAGLMCMLTDGDANAAGAELASSGNALRNAAATAIGHINDPSRARSPRATAVRKMPADERRAYYRERARERRARLRKLAG